eukprot:NODE_126_length_17250_cov_2.558743.p5 type:complete len:469 gc:universal NODE_126_length_17250_cov_2.558743:4499-5905(+)
MDDSQKSALVAEADYFFKKSDLEKALELYSKVLTLDADKHSLLYRGYCYSSNADYDLALKDVETLLKVDSNNFKGILLKASILFDMGEFEMSLILYIKALNMKGGEEVDAGIFKCKNAILTLFNDSDDFGEMQDLDKLIKRHMPDFASDYYFLKSISAQFAESKDVQISQIAEDGLCYLKKRLEFWKNYKHHDKVDGKKIRAKVSQELKSIKEKRKLPSLPSKKNHSKKSVSNKQPSLVQESTKDLSPELLSQEDLCRRIRKTFENEDFKYVKILCEEYLRREIKIAGKPTAQQYCDVLLDYSHALLELQESLEISKAKASQVKNITQVFQLNSYYPRCLNILGKCYAKSEKFEKAIKLWEERMKFDSSPVEKAWLYHDLGKCYLSLGKIDKSKECGRLSLEFSDQIGSRSWSAASKILLGQCFEAEGYVWDAISYFEKAVKSARACGDKSQLNGLEQHLVRLRASIK